MQFLIFKQKNNYLFVIKAKFKAVAVLLLMFFFQNFNAENILMENVLTADYIQIIDTENIAANEIVELNTKRPNPIIQLLKIKQKRNKKITAAILAFPFPFGIVGLHRIYLGTAPHVPVVYIGSLGGIFGILPFIDFCVLILDKDVDRYNENKKVFMWVN